MAHVHLRLRMGAGDSIYNVVVDTQFRQIMIHFMDGTHEGGTNLYGQTLREENEVS